MNYLHKALLPTLIASVLATPAVYAQNDQCVDLTGTPPGLYTTTDEGRTFLIKDDQIVELGPGEAGFADGQGVKCINKTPEFLNWPCSTQAAQSRKFATYQLDEVPSDANRAREIVRRYFEIPEVIAPVPNWVDGEYHAKFSTNEILQFSSSEFWYTPSEETPFMSPKRPRSLLISLYVGINKVVVDGHAFEKLHKELGSDEIPVTFVFNDSNAVPISYFGPNVSMEELLKASQERGIKVAEVPMWWLGDHHLDPTFQEFEKFFDIPALSDISPERQAVLKTDLETNGFSLKPIIVTVLTDTGTLTVDQPQRVRMAAEMGVDRIPTVMNFVEPDILLARCGPGTPTGSDAASISGDSTPIGGATLPPGTPVVPPPIEPEASDS